jgi:hypothetical protein
MFRNIVLAVLIAIVLTYSFGHVATDWFDVHLSLADHDLDAATSVLAFCAMAVILVVIGFMIALSIFAAIAFILIAVAIGVFIAGLSVFWPVILFAIVIFLLVRDKKTPAY